MDQRRVATDVGGLNDTSDMRSMTVPNSERHYRVIADRDKGDDPQLFDAVRGDRVTYIEHGEVVRIERPVPTTEDDAPFVCGNVEDSNLTPAEKVLLRFAVDNPAVDPRMFESLASELRALMLNGASDD